MLTPSADGSTPSSPGSTSAISGYASQYNVPLAGSGAGASSSDPFVYSPIKQVKSGKNTNATVAEFSTNAAPRFPGRTISQLQAEFLNMNQDKQRHWAYLLALAGYAGQDAADPTKAAQFAKTAPLQFVAQYHNDFLKDAAAQFAMGRNVTPEQMLRQQLKYRFGNAFNGNLNTLTPNKAGALGAAGGLSGTHTQVSKSVDLMSPQDAKGLVRNTLQQQLGRDPTAAEYEDFVATIHAAERANPSVSTTQSTTDTSGNVTNQSTTTTGGINASGYDQLLYDKAKQMPTWAEWQAVGTYAPALFAALDAPISGV